MLFRLLITSVTSRESSYRTDMTTWGLDAKVMMATLTLISKLKICEDQMRGSLRSLGTEGERVREQAKGPRGGREPGPRAGTC